MVVAALVVVWLSARDTDGTAGAATSTPRGTAEAPAQAPTTSVPMPTRIDLPNSAAECGSVSDLAVYRGNDHTSCPFSENVARAFAALGQPATEAVTLEGVYSPVTGLTYTLECSFSTPVRCVGGNDAAIYLLPVRSGTRAADRDPAGIPMEDAAGRDLVPKRIGENAGLVSDTGERLVEFTVDAITPYFECTSANALAPTNGMFVAIQLTAITLSAFAEQEMPTFALGTSDVSAYRGDARVVDSVGTAPDCVDDQFPELRPGQSASGVVVADVPVDISSVAFTPPWLEGRGWEWGMP